MDLFLFLFPLVSVAPPSLFIEGRMPAEVPFAPAFFVGLAAVGLFPWFWPRFRSSICLGFLSQALTLRAQERNAVAWV